MMDLGSNVYNYQFGEGPRGPKASWNYMSEMSKCDTGNSSFLCKSTASLQLQLKEIHEKI